MIAQTGQRPPMSPTVDFGLELMRPDANTDPYPLFHRMRREDPVHYSRTLRAWLVTRYDDSSRGSATTVSEAIGPGSSLTDNSGQGTGASSRTSSASSAG